MGTTGYLFYLFIGIALGFLMGYIKGFDYGRENN